ncbi:MAG TPA: anhydro-N-acetylmuramic acid kinase [Gammaproteobacteria bacterium]|nr:anhydro-N-acetylmuramic acid kinase [Gammaproteobacteria bacterium]
MSGACIGLISGTSADGIDAVLMEFGPAPRITATHFSPYPEPVRERVLKLASGRHAQDPVEEFGGLDVELAELFAAAALALLEESGTQAAAVRAIGSHGQTVRHRPRARHPFTLQIADPNVIAARTGITVVADFRRRDVALGGQGAPLLPAFHRVAFSHPTEERVVANIGGIANLTLLAPGAEVRGFDTGPGNVLMDLWSREHLGTAYDKDGDFAASGRVDAVLLETLLRDPYFAAAPPKSTGPEHFNQTWLKAAIGSRQLETKDVAATLCELTARSIADTALKHANRVRALYVCGGGAHNVQLMTRLAACMPEASVQSTEALGIHPDWVEAAGFAWLAHQTLEGKPGNLPSVTGAGKSTVLGAIYPSGK